MAKKRTGIVKSKEIRDYLEENPSATPKQIVEALAQKGIQVTHSLASNVKYTSGIGRKRRRRRGRKKVAVTPAIQKRVGRRPSAAVSGLSAEDLVLANQFAQQVGGVEQAQKALETLQQLR